MKKLYSLLIITLVISLSSFKVNNDPEEQESGVFSCKINGKPFIIKDMKANLRTITGGHKELSLSNDKFSTFIFINPAEKQIDLSTKGREAFVRYTEPGVNDLFRPNSGVIKIVTLDEENLVLSGEFEFEMSLGNNQSKKVKVTEGKMINIPIEAERH
ncbi:hypothetical protein RCC89_14805 [Cytophagaceae bacterium ABcell3]|nr:hypothetical protein RCC89_14805 [Cytophagaceae bacterium ABcell3]